LDGIQRGSKGWEPNALGLGGLPSPSSGILRASSYHRVSKIQGVFHLEDSIGFEGASLSLVLLFNMVFLKGLKP